MPQEDADSSRIGVAVDNRILLGGTPIVFIEKLGIKNLFNLDLLLLSRSLKILCTHLAIKGACGGALIIR
ncbi:MAG: hypothetical protein ACTSR8_04550 [Promethearchaeota archaeon]